MMIRFLTRSHSWMLRWCVGAAGGVMTIVGAATPARGQCDPQQLAKLFATDPGVGDILGYSVAVDGDTAVVGAVDDDPGGLNNGGTAYVFVRSGGIWTEQFQLIASDAAVFDQFGFSVALSVDTALVGARFDDDGGSDSGSAYVFVRSGGAWTQQAKLTASDAAAGDDFGQWVSLSGDTALIGARADNLSGANDAGSAYVFTRSGGVWTEQGKLTASDAEAGDEFGQSVAISGDTAVVGAHDDDNASGIDAGSAYIFVMPPGGWTNMTETAKLSVSAAEAAPGDQFGFSVSLSGDTAVITAFVDDRPGAVDAGSAYVFVMPPGGWTSMTETAVLSASDAAANDRFGFSVAVKGETALVGAYLDDHAGGSDAGSAYVFLKPIGGWANMTETTKLTAADAGASHRFGHSVGLLSDAAVVGAPYDTPTGVTESGSAYVMRLFCDCNYNGSDDRCDTDCSLPNCNHSGCGQSEDCNHNHTPDECETDTDFDRIINPCDPDDDNDGVHDGGDPAPTDPNICGDADDDGCDDCSIGTDDFGPLADNLTGNDGPDTDGDGICDVGDNCHLTPNPDQVDVDGDVVGDVCDKCVSVYNPTQIDTDGDGLGDLCDNCPNVPNPVQEDCDDDGKGNACPCPQRGDMNDDGLIDGNDIQLFVEAALGA